MKHTCKQFTREDISKFVDNELSLQKHQELENHIQQCEHCKAAARDFTTMASIFSHHAEQQFTQTDAEKIKTGLARAIQKPKPALSHFYLKLASFAIILVISFFTFQNTVFSPSGPSAIVKSVDTDFASVMIIETQKEKHTIIWFSET